MYADEPHDVVLVTEEGGAVQRFPHLSRDSACEWAEQNEHHFEGHLVVVRHGEKVPE